MRPFEWSSFWALWFFLTIKKMRFSLKERSSCNAGEMYSSTFSCFVVFVVLLIDNSVTFFQADGAGNPVGPSGNVPLKVSQYFHF